MGTKLMNKMMVNQTLEKLNTEKMLKRITKLKIKKISRKIHKTKILKRLKMMSRIL